MKWKLFCNPGDCGEVDTVLAQGDVCMESQECQNWKKLNKKKKQINEYMNQHRGTFWIILFFLNNIIENCKSQGQKSNLLLFSFDFKLTFDFSSCLFFLKLPLQFAVGLLGLSNRKKKIKRTLSLFYFNFIKNVNSIS